MAYAPKTWNDLPDESTPVTAGDLNRIETGVAEAHAPKWGDIAEKPTAFPPAIGSGAGQAVAGNDTRLTAGAAGTATVRAIGSTATTAAAGNHTHAATAITATAIGPGTATNVQGILAELAARITAVETP